MIALVICVEFADFGGVWHLRFVCAFVCFKVSCGFGWLLIVLIVFCLAGGYYIRYCFIFVWISGYVCL